MSSTKRKHCSTSCLNCRLKKKKCDGSDVCLRCLSLGVPCERLNQDQRSHRLTSREVKQLQETCASMESTLARISELTQDSDHESALKQIKVFLEDSGAIKTISSSKKKIPVSIDASGGGEYSVFGPTSAFLNLVEVSERSAPAHLYSNGFMNTSQLMASLESFFKWMYPDITVFIHRESFLNEFLSPQRSQGYCSEELVYAIAALGAKCSPSEDLRSLAQNFFDRARNKILTTRVCIPQINTLQALLCLSLYELGEGNTLASWMLSGMAIRMGYDLGFQLDPHDWSLGDGQSGLPQQALITDINVMVRSRIYWGCYIVDHFVSLVMGRPVTVRKTEASIPTSEVLPNSSNIESFVYQPEISPQSVKNLDAFHTIEPLCLLSECVGSLLTDIYAGEYTDENLTYLNKMKLAKYNGFLASWRRKLPLSLKWTVVSLKQHNYNPTMANYRLFYYIVLICLNKPFVNVQMDVFLDQSPRKLLASATSELSLCLQKFNESGCPPSILIVYSSILGLSIALVQLQGISKTHPISSSKIHDLQVCYTTVSNACAHWRLAAKSLVYVEKKVAEIGHPAVSAIFGPITELFENKLSDIDLAEILEQGENLSNWVNQDNLFANFFDILDHA